MKKPILVALSLCFLMTSCIDQRAPNSQSRRCIPEGASKSDRKCRCSANMCNCTADCPCKCEE